MKYLLDYKVANNRAIFFFLVMVSGIQRSGMHLYIQLQEELHRWKALKKIWIQIGLLLCVG